MSARSVRLAAVWGLAAVSLAAQTPVTGTAAGLVLNVRARDAGGTGAVTRVSGTAIGFGGSVQFRRFAIGLRYAEGTLQPVDAQSDRRDLVEGAIALNSWRPRLTFRVHLQIVVPSDKATDRSRTWGNVSGPRFVCGLGSTGAGITVRDAPQRDDARRW